MANRKGVSDLTSSLSFQTIQADTARLLERFHPGQKMQACMLESQRYLSSKTSVRDDIRPLRAGSTSFNVYFLLAGQDELLRVYILAYIFSILLACYSPLPDGVYSTFACSSKPGQAHCRLEMLLWSQRNFLPFFP